MAAIAIAAVAAVAVRSIFWSDARLVRRQLGAMANAASAPANESEIDRVARAARLSRMMTDGVIIRQGASSFVGGRQAVAGWVLQGVTEFGPFKVALSDQRVSLEDARTATVFATVSLAPDKLGISPPDPRQVHVTLTKVDGEWLLSAAEVLRVLEPARSVEGQ